MTKNAWILVNRYCLTFNIYRPFLVDSSVKYYRKLGKIIFGVTKIRFAIKITKNQLLYFVFAQMNATRCIGGQNKMFSCLYADCVLALNETVVPSDAACVNGILISLLFERIIHTFPRSYVRSMQPMRNFFALKSKLFRKKICTYAFFVVPLHAFSRFGLPSSAAKGTDDANFCMPTSTT